MLNYKSVRSSQPQIRSNPALRHVPESSGFQKRLSTLLEPIALPFPTFQILKESAQPILEKHMHYAWIRPAHLRPQWLILADGFPLIMSDPRRENGLWSIRIPFDRQIVQKIGPIVLEGAWDAQDHILWIWDVIVWEKSVIWNTIPYSERWKLVMRTVNEILDCGHPMSDAEVNVPTWKSLEEIAKYNDLDSAKSIDFQPEKPGNRKIVFLIRDNDTKFNPGSHHERKMVAENSVKYNKVEENKQVENKTLEEKKPTENNPVISSSNPIEKEKYLVGRLHKDKHSKLPDTYYLTSIENKDIGLAAIRSIEISKQLREKFKTTDSVLVDILWFEPFHKYEVKKIH